MTLYEFFAKPVLGDASTFSLLFGLAWAIGGYIICERDMRRKK